MFTLCKSNKASVNHVFLFYLYTMQVLKLMKGEFKQNSSWNNIRHENYLKNWFSDKSIKIFKGLPCILVNIIWWAHNVWIFKNEEVPPEVSIGHIIKISKELKYGYFHSSS
jgi:hypothetical protein